MVNLPCRDSRFTNHIDELKRAKKPLNIMDALDDLRLHGTRKMLRWYLNVFEMRPQFWKNDDWYLLHDNAPTYRSNLIKEFFFKTHICIPPIHQTLPRVTFAINKNQFISVQLSVPINKKQFTVTSFCAIRRSERSIAGGLTEG
ncbi:hypothetical protein TNCV_3376091 [Trichonephila clavipes]|nr:hypothetical protein TNCV_3376091 [Trichonephila clavipes]